MGNIEEKPKCLYEAVDEVLYYIWDPICVSDVPEARDEYRSYNSIIVEAVRNNKSANEIAEILNKIVVEKIGLKANMGKSLEVANVVLNWKDIFEK